MTDLLTEWPILEAAIVLSAIVALYLIYLLIEGIYASFLWEASSQRQFIVLKNRVYHRVVSAPVILRPKWMGEELARGRRFSKKFTIAKGAADGSDIVLMEPRTGALSMARNTMTILDIDAQTQERHQLIVDATIVFKLDDKSLFHCMQIDDLGAELRARLVACVQREILRRDDRKVAVETDRIRAALKQELTDADLGVDVVDAMVHTRESAEGGGATVAGATVATVADNSVEALGQRVGLTPRQLDKVRDVFLPKYPDAAPDENGNRQQQLPFTELPPEERERLMVRAREDYERANAMTLRFLELWTQRVTAEALSSAKGSVIVLPADEAGLAATAAQFRLDEEVNGPLRRDAAGSGDRTRG